MLSTQQIQLIQQSYAAADSRPEALIARLFERLFELDPGLRYLFPADMEGLVRRFGFMLGFLVHRLDQWDDIVPQLRNLGIRHISYGVRTCHYKVFGEAFMDAVLDCLGPPSDSEATSAWSHLYREVSEIMVAAGEMPEVTSCSDVPRCH